LISLKRARQFDAGTPGKRLAGRLQGWKFAGRTALRDI
jgi:hypothetical protein